MQNKKLVQYGIIAGVLIAGYIGYDLYKAAKDTAGKVAAPVTGAIGVISHGVVAVENGVGAVITGAETVGSDLSDETAKLYHWFFG